MRRVNLSQPLRASTLLLYRIGMRSRRFLPKQKCHAFGRPTANGQPRIEGIYVINLDRQVDRWREMERELQRVSDASGAGLANLVERYPAVDARTFERRPPFGKDVNPFYTLGTSYSWNPNRTPFRTD